VTVGIGIFGDMALSLQLGLLALVGWGIWSALKPRPIFVVRIEGGVPRVVRGKVTRSFVVQVRDACNRHGVDRGSVRGLATGRTITLTFTKNIPPAFRQQLRNEWALSGWSLGQSRTKL
jgi:hypothetical protein